MILGQNIRFPLGEVDILAEASGTIVLVEVKTHTRLTAVHPIYKVNVAKQRKLWQLARLVSARYPARNIRIDAITVYWEHGQEEPIVTHYENILN